MYDNRLVFKINNHNAFMWLLIMNVRWCINSNNGVVLCIVVHFQLVPCLSHIHTHIYTLHGQGCTPFYNPTIFSAQYSKSNETLDMFNLRYEHLVHVLHAIHTHTHTVWTRIGDTKSDIRAVNHQIFPWLSFPMRR